VEKIKKNVKKRKKRDLNKKRKKRLLHLWFCVLSFITGLTAVYVNKYFN